MPIAQFAGLGQGLVGWRPAKAVGGGDLILLEFSQARVVFGPGLCYEVSGAEHLQEGAQVEGVAVGERAASLVRQFRRDLRHHRAYDHVSAGGPYKLLPMPADRGGLRPVELPAYIVLTRVMHLPFFR